jgi:hypothetical protein
MNFWSISSLVSSLARLMVLSARSHSSSRLGFTLATPGAFSLLDYGALRVRVDAKGVTYTFVDERGRVLDRHRGSLTGP